MPFDRELFAYTERLSSVMKPPPVRLTGAQQEEIRATKQKKAQLAHARKELEVSPLPGVKAITTQVGAGFVSTAARLFGKDKYADALNRFAGAIEQVAQEREKGGIVPDWLQRQARGAAVSVGTIVPAGMTAGPYGAIGFAATQEANKAWTEGRDAGKKGSDLAAYVVAQGAIEGALAGGMQVAGFGGLESIFGKKTTSDAIAVGIKQGFKRLGISAGQELVEEIPTELAHRVAARLANVDPNELTIEGLIQTVADTTGQTLLAVGFSGAPSVARSIDAGKVAKITDDAIAYAREGRIPSRKTWREWNLEPQMGESRSQRRAFTQELAGQLERLEVAPEAAVEPAAEVAVQGAPVAAVVPEVAPAIEQAIPGVEAARALEVAPEEVPLAGDSAAKPPLVEPIKLPKRTILATAEARAIARDFMSLASPGHVGEVTRRAGHIMREKAAQSAQQSQAAEAKLRKVERTFWAMSPEGRLGFIHKMEQGVSQESAVLDDVAKVLRAELDGARKRVQQKTGKLQEFFEDYFPHLWKSRADSDVALGRILSRPFRPTAFLKKRKIPTIREGIEAGLELVTDNPVDLALMRIQHMNEYVAKTEAMDTLKRDGIAKFVPANFEKNYMPGGYDFVDDPAFTVQTTGDVTIEEAYDKLLFDQLMSVAKAIGVSHKRVIKLEAWGISVVGKKRIETKFGGPLSNLAHEIGHQIGDIYGLHDFIIKSNPKAAKELKALAQLRYEGAIPTLEFQRYVEEKPEKEAVLLEAWLAAPEKMAQVAPNVTEAWKEFLAKNEHLTPLLMLDRSLVLQKGEAIIEQPGIRVLGRWALPKEVATMIKNHLSPGLRRSENRAVKTGYRLARHIGNAMNQASLSLSLFHGLNVLTDAVASQYALGLQQIVRGEGAKGTRNILLASTLVAPGLKAFRKGNVLVKAMNEDLSQIDNLELKDEIGSIIASGGRAFMDTRYHNHAVKSLMETLRNIRFGAPIQKAEAAIRMPVDLIFAGLEATSWPVMRYLVPRLKLGVFSQMAEDVYNRADNEELTEFQVREQLTQAWDSVDNRMGQLAYDNLFWNQYVKDVSMLAVRSVGWNLGSIREYGGAMLDAPTFQARIARGDQFLSRKMAYAIGAVMTYAPIGAILTYLLTGESPEELKDYFFPRTGGINPDGSAERISLPTYAKDWMAWPTDPVKTARHKLHPMWGTLSSVFSNEDYYGTEIRNSDDPFMIQLIDAVAHAGESFIPFSVKNYERMREAGEPTSIAAPLAILGISSAPGYLTRTRAQKLAIQYLTIRMPSGSRTKIEAEAVRKRRNLLKRLRGGETLIADDLTGLTQRQLQRLSVDYKLTPFQSLFRRLTFEESLNVFVQCNKEEKKQVTWMLQNKASKAQEVSEGAIKLFGELDLQTPPE